MISKRIIGGCLSAVCVAVLSSGIFLVGGWLAVGLSFSLYAALSRFEDMCLGPQATVSDIQEETS